MQKAVKKHYELLQKEFNDLKTKLNAKSNTDLVSPGLSCKLEFVFLPVPYIMWP